MQILTIDKKKTPDIGDWAADKQPGDRVCLYGTIKANDDQTLTVTLEEIDDDMEEETEPEKPAMGNEGSDAAAVGSMEGMMDEED